MASAVYPQTQDRFVRLIAGYWQAKRLHCGPQSADRNNVFSVCKEAFQKDGATEIFKAENKILWVQKINNLRKIATETVIIQII